MKDRQIPRVSPSERVKLNEGYDGQKFNNNSFILGIMISVIFIMIFISAISWIN